MSTNTLQDQGRFKVAGIHVSGPNTHRSTALVLSGRALNEPLRIEAYYEKIGSRGQMFSDERIVSILRHESPLREVFVDCPLSVPPCVACQRPKCPGVLACDDLSVAYMLALGEKLPKRRRRPVNPQSQRVWDILSQIEYEEAVEPTYSAHLAPLVVRARSLRRRLKAEIPSLVLRETSVPWALKIIVEQLQLSLDHALLFRNFERGREVRHAILARLVQQGWLVDDIDDDVKLGLERSGDLFHALVTGLVAAFHHLGLSQDRPESFLVNEGWVVLPKFVEPFLNLAPEVDPVRYFE